MRHEEGTGARAVWFRGPRWVELDEAPLPELGDGELLVRTTASGISAGTELLAYRGELDPDLPLDETIGALGGTFTYPFRYGYSCVGRVQRSRSTVPAGSLVFAFHPHQDVFVARAPDVVALDDDTDPRLATLFPLVETALQVVLDGGAVQHELVVVTGLGAVGLLVALLLQQAGAVVVGIEPRGWRREIATAFGIDPAHPDELGRRVAAISEGRGVALVVEASGAPEALAGALQVLAHEGTALVASWYGAKAVSLPLGGPFHRRRLTIRSTQVSTIPARLAHRWTVERRRSVVRSLLRRLPLERLATHELAFPDAPAAFAALDRGEEGVLHVALRYA